jgi:hypothetical protein
LGRHHAGKESGSIHVKILKDSEITSAMGWPSWHCP